MYIPNELWDIIIGFGLPWLLALRSVDRHFKSKIDQMVKKISSDSIYRNRYIPFVWQAPTYHITLTMTLCDKIYLYSVFSQIGLVISRKNPKITNVQICEVYDIVFHSSMSYTFQDILYKKLETLFDYTFTRCIDSLSIEYYRKFYNCIFLGMQYYTQFYRKTHVRDLFEERLKLFQNK